MDGRGERLGRGRILRAERVDSGSKTSVRASGSGELTLQLKEVRLPFLLLLELTRLQCSGRSAQPWTQRLTFLMVKRIKFATQSNRSRIRAAPQTVTAEVGP